MTLSTCAQDGFPNSRIVLLKGFDKRGFVFYTNYESDKGKELAANPNACLLFYWHPLQRTVRIRGKVEKTSEQESDDYFGSRPLKSRLAAIASNQSSVIPDKECLQMRFTKLLEECDEDASVPRPLHWGGYRLTPTSIEFWQGKSLS
ncbi:pyridoxine/pyridoxamine 5'-phosphate oxidase-like [Condylostylus longicornis]|uniref:pyridoxine/pyridoxamine 5'-phosphate oxidase-like n=1 Tax=Condylostylus longicornis TaxID=2530218 RepID=UPI00244DF674|nr:pyridoxine/pyridoxamine 5'-phosphate oxidase-like [Condylostylus longicornis]